MHKPRTNTNILEINQSLIELMAEWRISEKDDELIFTKIAGLQLKKIRLMRGFTQTRVAKSINVTFQQIQKYEKGKNGCSAIRLKQLADFFKVSTDILIDPNFIPTHRDFTGKMDWLQHEAEIEKEQERQAYREEFMKENANANNKS